MNFFFRAEIPCHSFLEFHFFLRKYFVIRDETNIFNQILEVIKFNKFIFIFESLYYSTNSLFDATFCTNIKTKNELPKV